MAKTNWNTGDIITEDKVNLIETKVEALLNTVNSLVGVARGLEKYISKVETSQVKGLEELDEKNVIGYTSPADMEISEASEALETLIDNAITGRINTTWPDIATLENADDDIVGIKDGDSLATSVNSLKRYIDKCMNESYKTLITNIQNATTEYYSRYVKGDILITTISRENTGEEKGNTLSNKDTKLYWIPFGQGRVLIGAGTNGERSFLPQSKEELKGGQYTKTISNTDVIKSIVVDAPGVTTQSIKPGDKKAIKIPKNNKAPTVTINGKETTFDLLPPYIVVYFYKCCDVEEYNTYYNIQPSEETETDSSSEGTENNTPSEGASTDSENP